MRSWHGHHNRDQHVSPAAHRRAALDSAIYEEVEGDPRATGQALIVIVLSSLAAGVGSRGLGGTTLPNAAFFAIVALMAWARLGAAHAADRLAPACRMPAPASDMGELLRTTGFAATPGLLRVFGILPGVTIPVFVITAIWMLAAMVVAVRQALDYRSTGRAIAVCVIGWILAIVFAVGMGLFWIRPFPDARDRRPSSGGRTPAATECSAAALEGKISAVTVSADLASRLAQGRRLSDDEIGSLAATYDIIKLGMLADEVAPAAARHADDVSCAWRTSRAIPARRRRGPPAAGEVRIVGTPLSRKAAVERVREVVGAGAAALRSRAFRWRISSSSRRASG